MLPNILGNACLEFNIPSEEEVVSINIIPKYTYDKNKNIFCVEILDKSVSHYGVAKDLIVGLNKKSSLASIYILNINIWSWV